MIVIAKQDFCAHGFTIGFCPSYCVRDFYHAEAARTRRKEFLKMFKRRDWRNPVTRETIILRLHQFHREEQYLQLPINLVTMGKVKCYGRNER